MLALAMVLAAAHPSVFFSASDVKALRQAAQTTHASIANHLTGTLNAHLADPAPLPTDYSDPRYFGNQPAVWAFAYQLTGDTRYAEKARQILLTYLTWSDWGFGEVASLGEPDLNEGHFLLGVSAAYDWLEPYLPASEALQIAQRLGTEAQKMADGMPTAWWVDQYLQNHNWINTAGLGLAGLALAGEDPRAATWLSQASQNLLKLSRALGPISDGTWHEGIPYQGYGISMALPFWTALARAGTDYTDLGILRGYGRWFLAAQIPDAGRQVILPFGDFTGNTLQAHVEVLRFAAGRFHDGVAEAAAGRWLSAGTRDSFVPELWYEIFEFLYYDPTVAAVDPHLLPLDSTFTDLQASILRSSWDPGDLELAFKGGPYGGRANFDRVHAGGTPGGWIPWGHDHNDDMSFWLFGSGTWLAPEAVGYDAGANASNSNPANQTAYHNSLLVDGQGELGDLRVSDSNWNNAWFWQRDASLLPTLSTADYALSGGRGAGLFAASLGLTQWDRMLLLARHRYVLVHDDVQASAAHAYDWICHFQDGVNVDTASGWVQGVNKKGQSLGVRVISPAAWSFTTGSQTAPLMNLFDPDGQTSWVRVRPAVSAARAQFLTALVPIAAAQWASRPRIDALSSSDPGAGAVVAPGSALEERWIFAGPAADGRAAGDLALAQSLAGLAVRDASGSPRRTVLFGRGKLSDLGGSRMLLSTLSARSLEVDLQGALLVVSGDSIQDFRAFAPAASSVTINGRAAAVSFASGLVIWPPEAAPDGGTGGADAGGADAGADAGPTRSGDAGTPEAGDGGSAPSPDAGVSLPPDAGALNSYDAGSVPVALSFVGGASGCGCSSRGSGNPSAFFGLGLLVAFLSSRRRRRQRAGRAAAEAAEVKFDTCPAVVP